MGHAERFRRLMNGGNGSVAPRVDDANIPIIGAPFTLEGWFFQIVLMCRCDNPKPVLLVGQPPHAKSQCQHCKRIYMLLGISITPDGKPNFNVGMQVPNDVPAAPPPPPPEMNPEG